MRHSQDSLDPLRIQAATEYLPAAGAEDAVEVVAVFGVGRVCVANKGEDGKVHNRGYALVGQVQVWENLEGVGRRGGQSRGNGLVGGEMIID